MNGWKAGPIEQRIAPPIQRVITLYLDGVPLVVYVGVAGFHEIKTDDELDALTDAVHVTSELILLTLNKAVDL